MNCDICTTDLSGAGQSMFPCCNRVAHTICLISQVANNADNHIFCTCGNILYTSPPNEYFSETYTEAATAAATLLDTPAVQADLKALKKKITLMTKARTAFSKTLKEKFGAFKAATEQQVDQIKELKKTISQELKATPEYKESLKCKRACEGTILAFRTKYDMSRAVLREVVGANIYYRYLFSHDSARILRRKFRLRL